MSSASDGVRAQMRECATIVLVGARTFCVDKRGVGTSGLLISATDVG